MGKIANKATMSILKPVLDQMKRERKEEVRRYNSLLDQAAENVMLERIEEMKPKTYEVHQPFDSIIHQHSLW